MFESEKPIIPIFYEVKPADLRGAQEHRGAYAAALDKHENRIAWNGQPRHNSTTVGKWRNALSRAAHISGFDLDAFNGDVGKLLDKVVKWVLERVKSPNLFDVGKHIFGLDEKAQDFHRKVLSQQHGGRVQVVVIAGPEGVGKTTLSQELFNRNSSNYNDSYFLLDVRENSKWSLTSLQKKILKGLTRLNQDVDNVDEGKWMLQKHLSKSRVLLVLDDVDDADHVDALLPVDVLHPESLVLITSRNKDVLKWSAIQESSIYHLCGLDQHHSTQLFCVYAFGQPHPKSGFEYLVHQFLKDCNGVPLYLQKCGKLVNNKNNKSDWEDQLKKLRQTLHTDIPRSLQISSVIRNRSGSILDYVNTIVMHDHLRALARNLQKCLELVPRPRRGIEGFNDGIEEFNDLSHAMKRIVLKSLAFEDNDKSKRRVMKSIICVEGVNSISVDVKEMKLTVIGSADPVFLVVRLRKFGFAELLSVGPA